MASRAAAFEQRDFGGFGEAWVGLYGGTFGPFEDQLSAPTALGAGFAIAPLALQVGGSGRLLLWRSLLIGGRAYGTFPDSDAGDRGTASFAGGGGGLDVGAVVWRRQRWMLHPYAHLGGAGYSLELENTGRGEVAVGGLRLAPGERESLTSGVGVFELGIGATYLLFGEGHEAGLIVVLEAGFHGSAFAIPWSDERDLRIDGLDRPALRGGFIRLKLGGGGWFGLGD